MPKPFKLAFKGGKKEEIVTLGDFEVSLGSIEKAVSLASKDASGPKKSVDPKRPATATKSAVGSSSAGPLP